MAQVGDVIKLNLKTTAGSLYPHVLLYDPKGTALATMVGRNGKALPATERYTLFVRDWGPQDPKLRAETSDEQ